jgi:hypothetical protein
MLTDGVMVCIMVLRRIQMENNTVSIPLYEWIDKNGNVRVCTLHYKEEQTTFDVLVPDNKEDQ